MPCCAPTLPLSRIFVFVLAVLVSLVPCISFAADTAAKRWYKGNTHTHTLWSDGNDFPEMIADWYKSQGYHFLALSDHNVLQVTETWMSEAAIQKRKKSLGKTTLEKYRARFGDEWVTTREMEGQKEVRLKKLEEYRLLLEEPEKFLLVPAEEVSAGFEVTLKNKAPIHINGINLSEVIKPIEGTGFVDVMRKNLAAIRAQEQRFGQPTLGHVNHPNFRWALTPENLAEAVEENYFEIWNGHPGINYQGDATRMGHEKMWDIANTLRIAKLKAPPLFGMGTDDAHHYHGESSSPGRGWIMVRSDKLEAGALIRALRAGDFYASSGVMLEDVRFNNGKLTIRIQAKPGVTYTTQIKGTRVEYDATTIAVRTAPDDPQAVRNRYSDDVGMVFANIPGTEFSYTLTGEELYVRAVITSSEAPVNPVWATQKQMAWTQPVGWELWVSAK